MTRPVGGKVGLPQQIVPRRHIDGDRVGFQRVVPHGYRAQDIVDFGLHQTDDALYDLWRDLHGEVIAFWGPAPILASSSRSSSLIVGFWRPAILFWPQLPGAVGPTRTVRAAFPRSVLWTRTLRSSS